MAEYVERDRAIEACFDGYADCREDCAENIRKLRAADVVEVVRCRDCKHAPIFWDEDDPFAVKWPQRGAWGGCEVDDETCPHFVGDYSYTRPPDPDGFCEKGERKT